MWMIFYLQPMTRMYEVKHFLSKNFDMKDINDASYVIGIKILGIDIEVFWVYHKKPISIRFWRDFR